MSQSVEQSSEGQQVLTSVEELIYPIKKFKAYHHYYNSKRKTIMEEEMRQKQKEGDSGGNREQQANLANLANVAVAAAAAAAVAEQKEAYKKKTRKPMSRRRAPHEGGGDMMNESELLDNCENHLLKNVPANEEEPGEVVDRMNGCETGDEAHLERSMSEQKSLLNYFII